MNTTESYSSEHQWFTTPSHSRRGSMESELSIQGKETDYVRDTSDTDCSSTDKGEYEPVTEPEDDGPFDSDLSSGESDDEDIIKTKVIEISVGDDGDIEFADSEHTGSDSDSEIDLYDYWKCAQCRTENNNPLYRFCEKCYKVRKSFYPPRPRKNKPKPVTDVPRAYSFDSGVESAFNSQELSQPTDLSQPTELSQPIELGQRTDLSQKTEVSEPIELSQRTELCELTELSQPTDLSQRTDLGLTIDLLQTNQDDHESTSSAQQLKLSDEFIMTLTKPIKRRAESADRCSKRLKLDTSDSDSDLEADAEPRRRKAKSADPEVAKPFKTVSDPAITVEDTLQLTKKAIINSLKGKIDDDNLCIICFTKPKSAVFVHGRIAHICTCYECGNKVWRKAKRCPQCNCKVSNVLKVM